jgi:hypothetical protein
MNNLEPTPPPGRPEVCAYLMGDEFRKKLKTAKVIMGADPNTKNLFVVYGRDLVKTVAAELVPVADGLLVVQILQDTEELEILLAAVNVVKGQDEYISDDERVIN